MRGESAERTAPRAREFPLELFADDDMLGSSVAVSPLVLSHEVLSHDPVVWFQRFGTPPGP